MWCVTFLQVIFKLFKPPAQSFSDPGSSGPKIAGTSHNFPIVQFSLNYIPDIPDCRQKLKIFLKNQQNYAATLAHKNDTYNQEQHERKGDENDEDKEEDKNGTSNGDRDRDGVGDGDGDGNIDRDGDIDGDRDGVSMSMRMRMQT